MPGHVHVSLLQAWVVFVFVVALGLLWRGTSTKIADTPIGKAMHILY